MFTHSIDPFHDVSSWNKQFSVYHRNISVKQVHAGVQKNNSYYMELSLASRRPGAEGRTPVREATWNSRSTLLD